MVKLRKGFEMPGEARSCIGKEWNRKKSDGIAVIGYGNVWQRKVTEKLGMASFWISLVEPVLKSNGNVLKRQDA